MAILPSSILSKRVMRVKKNILLHTFIKSTLNVKKKKIFIHIMYSTNIKGPKNIWVPKVEKSSCDVDDVTDSYSSSNTTTETHMFECSTITR